MFGGGGRPVKFKKASFLTVILIVVLVAYAVITLVNLQDRISVTNEQIAQLEAKVLYAEQERALVEQDLEELGTDKSVKKIARARLGMVEAGEIVFYDSDVQH